MNGYLWYSHIRIWQATCCFFSIMKEAASSWRNKYSLTIRKSDFYYVYSMTSISTNQPSATRCTIKKYSKSFSHAKSKQENRESLHSYI